MRTHMVQGGNKQPNFSSCLLEACLCEYDLINTQSTYPVLSEIDITATSTKHVSQNKHLEI